VNVPDTDTSGGLPDVRGRVGRGSLWLDRILGFLNLSFIVVGLWAIHRDNDVLLLGAFVAEMILLVLSVALRRANLLPPPPAFRSTEQLKSLARSAFWFSAAMVAVAAAVTVDDGARGVPIAPLVLAVGGMTLGLYWRHAAHSS
jgi:hypothetical protein